MDSFKIRFRIHDLLFYLLLVVSFYYTRNKLCALMMIAFFGYTVIAMIIQKRRVQFSFYFFSFLAFILYGAGNVLMGNVINYSVARTMIVSLGFNFLMIFAIVQYISMSADVSRVLGVAELGIFSTAFLVIMLSLGTITEGRLGAGTEINSNMLGILCVYGFVLTFYLRKIGKVGKTSCLIKIAFYVLAIFLTGSRKGLVMMIIALAVVRFTQDRKKIFKNVLVLSATVIVCYVLIMNIEFLYNIIGVRIENMLELLAEDGDVNEGSLKERQNLVKIGMQYIREKPWTGYGYDCFKLISGRGANGKVSYGNVGYYSHNNYIELLFGGGIIGLVLYYISVAYLLVKLFRKIRKDTCMPYLLAMLISLLSIEYARVTYYARIDSYITGVLLGCAIIVEKVQDTQPSKNITEV